MPMQMSDDPVVARDPGSNVKYTVVTTTTFKSVSASQVAGTLVIETLQAPGAKVGFKNVNIEQVRGQGAVFTAYRETELKDFADSLIGVAYAAARAAEDLRGSLAQVGVQAQIVQAYGRLVIYGKQG